MTQEYFWGCELNKENREISWSPDVEFQEIEVKHSLLIKHALIGLSDSIVENEVNIIELETEGYLGDKIKLPIIRLKCGVVDHCQLDTFVPKSAKLRLKNGNGPVIIYGQHIVEFEEDVNETSETSDDMIEEEEISIESPSPEKNRKRKAENSTPKNKSNKMAKLESRVVMEDESKEENKEKIKKRPTVKSKSKASG